MKKKIGIFGVAAVTLILAGCGKQTKTAKVKQELAWSVPSQITTLDSSKAVDTVSMDALTNLGEGLYRNDKDGVPKLALAKKQVVSKDGKHYDFYLKKTKWSNGDDLTARDFVKTYQRTIDPKTTSQVAVDMRVFKNGEAILGGKKKVNTLGVSAPSKYHLHFDLEKPVSTMDQFLSLPLFFPQNEKMVKEAGSHYGTASKYFVSNGPFKIGKWNPNEKSWTLVKNKNYWDAKNVHLQKINEQYNASSITNYNLYKAGKIDNTVVTSGAHLTASEKKNFHTFPTYNMNRMDFNFKNQPAFKNLKIRQAISAAINRPELLKAMHNNGIVALGLVPENIGKNPKTKVSFAKEAYVKDSVSFDLKRAKKLWSEGKREENIKNLQLTLLTDNGGEDMAEYLQSNFSELPGLEVKIRHVPFTQHLAMAEAGQYDLNLTSSSPLSPNPGDCLTTFESGFAQNPGWKNKEYDNLLKLAENRDANNKMAEYKDYVAAEKLLMKQQVTVPLFQNQYSSLIKSKVKDYIFMPNFSQFDFKSAYVK